MPDYRTLKPPQASNTDKDGVVVVRDLTKRFGSRTAVNALSFELPAGVVAGFIGPNRAGKTTTMGMLLGLVAPTSGTGTVLGHPLEQPATFSVGLARSSSRPRAGPA